MVFKFESNWTVHPGAILQSYMDNCNCEISDIVRVTGFQKQDIRYILDGEKRVTPYISRKLSEVFRNLKPLAFYRMQKLFDADIAAGKKWVK